MGTRLSDLTRMLLSSPSFSGFLDTLASNPAAAQTAQAVQQQPQQVEQQQPQQRVRKDINPYAAQQQQMQQQHIGMTMIPEQTMDFSMLSLPETILDSETLSGKSSSFTPSISDAEKVELPKIERMPVSEPEKAELSVVVDEEFDADPAFALYSAPVPATTVSEPKQELDISFLANLSIKPSQYELVSKTDDAASDAALRRVERLARDMDACVERLMSLTMHL